jgi:hypothetical protein
MAPKSQAVSRQIGTRATNKLAHPGNVVKPTVTRRTSAEVQQEREAKAKAKADHEDKETRSILRAAEFEHADMANEAMVDATPRPPFTPKPWPPKKKAKQPKLVPIAESSENQIGDDDLETPLAPVSCDSLSSVTEDESFLLVTNDESSVTEDESEIEYAAPPTKKQKVTEKATRAVGASTKVAERGRKVGMDEKVVAASDEQPLPKPKKGKAKGKANVREEIKFVAKKMENEIKGDKYGDMMKSMSSNPPLQVQAAGGGSRKLKREGAIADINALYKKVTVVSANVSDQNVSNGNNNTDLMDIDK